MIGHRNKNNTGRNTSASIKSPLIAPCGMNCALCRGHLREKKSCPDCRGGNENKSFSCVNCVIKKCDELCKKNLRFCFSCDRYPCRRIQQMDKRYRTRYKMSTLENLETIKKIGIRKFVRKEKIRWACPRCGGLICVHDGVCPCCGR
jgi:hypothetical protein